jgi:hypothetical protein
MNKISTVNKKTEVTAHKDQSDHLLKFGVFKIIFILKSYNLKSPLNPPEGDLKILF